MPKAYGLQPNTEYLKFILYNYLPIGISFILILYHNFFSQIARKNTHFIRFSMNIQTFELQLYEKLNKFFFEHDYFLMSEKKQYRKITSTGFSNVIFTYNAYDTEILLDVNIGCRFEKVEKIAQQYLGNYRDYWEDANTLVVSIGKFNDSKNFKYKIQTEFDLEDACEDIRNFLLSRGFDFLAKYSTLESLNTLFNEKPNQPCKYVYNQSHRRFKGMIVAKLLNHKQFNDLSEKHQKGLVLSWASEHELQTFDRLMTFLMYASDN